MASSSIPTLTAHDAVLVVDVQRDFCPGGALPVEGAEEIIPILNEWIRAGIRAGALVVFSRDWHPPGHMSFEEEDGLWPAHCVQGTPGAEFHPDLERTLEVVVVSKGQDPDFDTYSAFRGTELAELLHDHGVHRLFVGGLAEDVCVRATVLDALRAGFEAHLLADATLPVDELDGARALLEMQKYGAIVEGRAALAGG